MIDTDKFARIRPIVGDKLFDKRVLIIGNFNTAPLIEYLSCCGVNRFYILTTSYDQQYTDQHISANAKIDQLVHRLQIDITNHNIDISNIDQIILEQDISIIVGTGGADEYKLICRLATIVNRLAIFYRLIDQYSGIMAIIKTDNSPVLTGQLFSFNEQAIAVNTINIKFSKLHLSNIVANYVKAILLQGSDYARTDIEEILNSDHQILLIGHKSWPWAIIPFNDAYQIEALIDKSANNNVEITNTTMINKNCLIIGLGSLGSICAEILYQLGSNLILMDGETVDIANPIRQLYRYDQVGIAKAEALIDQLTGDREGIYQHDDLTNHYCWQANDSSVNSTIQQAINGYRAIISEDEQSIDQFKKIITTHKVDLAIVATGTNYDRLISKILRTANIPHVVVSCYARAHYFEAIVINGQKGPCFGCVRGHLYLGKAPALTAEQRMRYIGNDVELQGEPATRIETGRAAELAAHIAYSLINLDQSDWLARSLNSEETFFLGGNRAERINDKDNHNEWAYGIEIPGTVGIFGLNDITGRDNYLECWDCGRRLTVNIKYQETVLTNFDMSLIDTVPYEY